MRFSVVFLTLAAATFLLLKCVEGESEDSQPELEPQAHTLFDAEDPALDPQVHGVYTLFDGEEDR